MDDGGLIALAYDVLGGTPALEWLGIFVARLVVGTMFALSGYHKLLDPDKREQMLKTMKRGDVPMPRFNARFVAATELVGGIALVLGLLTVFFAVTLIVVMVVAIFVEGIEQVDEDGLAKWLLNFLYLPEVLYLVIFVWLAIAGAGAFSLDALIFDAGVGRG